MVVPNGLEILILLKRSLDPGSLEIHPITSKEVTVT